MKFLADESLDFPIIEALRLKGFDVDAIVENNQGVDDQTVLALANSQGRILLTIDKDFGELTFRLKLLTTGIILLRLPELSNDDKSRILLDCIENHGGELPNSFCVITSSKIRIVSFS